MPRPATIAAQMPEDLLTTRDAAKLLGVGSSSVKRWADQGVLRCVRTAGGHRRIPRSAIAEFLSSGNLTVDLASDRVAAWVERLCAADGGDDVYRALRSEFDEHGVWWPVLDGLGTVLVEVGRRWAVGDISVLDEHIATARLERALVRCADQVVLRPTAPRALLATAPEDDHTLGLSLAELCLREAGYGTTFAGRRAPAADLAALIGDGGFAVVVLSASGYSVDDELLLRFARRIADACAQGGAKLLLGGTGHWPAALDDAARLHSFEQLWAQYAKR